MTVLMGGREANSKIYTEVLVSTSDRFRVVDIVSRNVIECLEIQFHEISPLAGLSRGDKKSNLIGFFQIAALSRAY